MSHRHARRAALDDRLARRHVLRGLAALGLAQVSLPVLSRPARADVNLTVFTWSGYDLPEIIAPFVAKRGAAPSFSLYGDNDEAFQKMNGGYRPDLVAPSSLMVGRFRDAGLIRPVDTARLSHWPDVFDKLKVLRGTQTGDQQWYVPQDWGNSSIVFRTDLVDPGYIERNSWTILWDERYAGRLAMNDQMDSAIIPAALVLGVPDPFNMTEAELAEVRKLLQAQKKLLRYYWSSQTEMEQAMAAGELVASYAWNDSVMRLKQQGVPVAYMTPVEGILSWVDGYCLVEGGPGDEAAAYDYLDAIISPESGKAMIELNAYGAANRKSFDMVDPALLANLGIERPTEVMDKGVFFDAIEGGLRDTYIDLYDEVKAGG